MKIKDARIETELTQHNAAKLIGTDYAMISRFENYQCLPTPKTFRRMCAVYDKKPEELYTPEEANLLPESPRIVRRVRHGTDGYKLTVRLPQRFANGLNEKLTACGYRGPTDWIYHCLRNLDRQYKRKRPPIRAAGELVKQSINDKEDTVND